MSPSSLPVTIGIELAHDKVWYCGTSLEAYDMAARRSGLTIVLAALNAIGLFTLYLSQTLVAERHWMTTLLTYMPQFPFGIPLLVLFVWALWKRDRYAVAWNTVGGAVFVFLILGVSLSPRLPGRVQGTSLNVMTLNMNHGSRGVEGVAGVVNEIEPDIICLQETNAHGGLDDPIPGLSKLLPDWELVRHGELATLSRHPVLSQRVHPLPLRTGRVILETTVSANGQRLTVLNVHFATADGAQSLSRRSVRLPSYLREAADVRSRQVSALLSIAESVSNPVIIAGDFNSPPRGRNYRRIAARYQDAFQAAGWGAGYTYRSDIPVMRIDQMFAGREMHISSCRTLGVAVSDHRPVIAQVVMPRISADR